MLLKHRSLLVGLLLASIAQAQWAPKAAPLMTRWAKEVSPDNALREYPRPSMRREKWQSLNGLWDYAVLRREDAAPERWHGQILVPFPLESALSGVMAALSPEQHLFYRRTFTVPNDWREGRVLLHFGAVDWEATVWVNGKELGTYTSGYSPFSCDITEALGNGEQELVVRVWDPTDTGPQPRGKQVLEPEGIFYTPTSGIWQTVWLEPVPEQHIRSVRIEPDFDGGRVRVWCDPPPRAGVELQVAVREGARVVAEGGGPAAGPVTVAIPGFKPWSPESPHLYEAEVLLSPHPLALDMVRVPFGMRKIAVGQDESGVTRLFLNNKPCFMIGLLDQGFWPDGLYTAPTDEALRWDIETARRLGYNTLRKHVKVEPDRWYHWCDRLGMIVLQDMPSGDESIVPTQPDLARSKESAAIFEEHSRRMIGSLFNHPSIVMWVPFNEGWGQFDTARITDLYRGLDATRLVNSASGWVDRGTGDVLDAHVYPGPGAPDPEERRASFLGEFGGLGLPLAGHTWLSEGNWGYRTLDTREKLNNEYVALLMRTRPLIIAPGLSGAIYTQLSDVETEVNGIVTYDREVVKLDEARVRTEHERLHGPPPRVRVIVPTSKAEPLEWRCTEADPGVGWEREDFDDSAWKRAPAGLGRAGTPGAVVRTEWHSGEIWARRAFTLAEADLAARDDLHLLIHHDEDAEVYLNGAHAATAPGYTTSYTIIAIGPRARAALRAGQNTIAIRCRQTAGGQYLDAGIVAVEGGHP